MFHLVREVGKTGVILIKIKVTLSRLADKNMVKLWPFLLSLSLYSTLKYTFSLSVAIKNLETCIWIHSNFCTLGVKGWESNVRLIFLNQFDHFISLCDCCNDCCDFKSILGDLIAYNLLGIWWLIVSDGTPINSLMTLLSGNLSCFLIFLWQCKRCFLFNGISSGLPV